MTEPTQPEPHAGAGPTEDDEEDVLRSLYGDPDAGGFYRSPEDAEDE